MTAVIVFFGIALIGLAALGVIGFVILGRTSQRRKAAEAQSDRILDELFDGSPAVTFETNMATLSYQTVVTGAIERGYRLTSQADNQYGPHTLVFERNA